MRQEERARARECAFLRRHRGGSERREEGKAKVCAIQPKADEPNHKLGEKVVVVVIAVVAPARRLAPIDVTVVA